MLQLELWGRYAFLGAIYIGESKLQGGRPFSRSFSSYHSGID